MIHFSVSGQHFSEWWVFGLFFLVIAALQSAWAFACWRMKDPRLLFAGAVFNAAIVVLWLFSRTTGIPVGPGSGTPEAWGVADSICAALELGSAVLVAYVLVRGPKQAAVGSMTRRRATSVLAMVTALVLVTGGVAIASTESSQDSMTSGTSATAMASGSTTMTPCTAGMKMAKHAHGAKGQGKKSHSKMANGTQANGNGNRTDMAQLPDVANATPEQTAAAESFVNETIAATAKYRNVKVADAAGFNVPKALARLNRKFPGNAGKPIKELHVANLANRMDGKILDPSAPETLIYSRAANGTFTLIGVMYTAEKKAPPVAYQPYLRWHFHAKCTPAGTVRQSGYMTHIWFVQPGDLVYGFAMSAPTTQILAYQATVR